MVNITFDDASLQKKLNQLIKNAPAMTSEIVKEVGVIVYDTAKSLVPIDTGELEDSLTLDIKQKGEVSEATVSSDLEYAAAVEYGTSKSRPQPYLRPAADAARGKMSEIAKAVFRQYD